MSDEIPQGYNKPPNGEPLHPEEWSAGYAAGFADAAERDARICDDMVLYTGHDCAKAIREA